MLKGRFPDKSTFQGFYYGRFADKLGKIAKFEYPYGCDYSQSGGCIYDTLRVCDFKLNMTRPQFSAYYKKNLTEFGADYDALLREPASGQARAELDGYLGRTHLNEDCTVDAQTGRITTALAHDRRQGIPGAAEEQKENGGADYECS